MNCLGVLRGVSGAVTRRRGGTAEASGGKYEGRRRRRGRGGGPGGAVGEEEEFGGGERTGGMRRSPDPTAVGLEGVAWPETCGRWWDEVDKKRMDGRAPVPTP